MTTGLLIRRSEVRVLSGVLRDREKTTYRILTGSCHPEEALATEGSPVHLADSSVADPAAQRARSLGMTRHDTAFAQVIFSRALSSTFALFRGRRPLRACSVERMILH